MRGGRATAVSHTHWPRSRLASLAIWPLALWGALRLAKPDSAWARRYYGERNPDKQARAEARYADRRVDHVKERVRDLIGGRPTTPPAGPN